MKTIETWLKDELTEKQFQQAINNTSKSRLELKVETFKKALFNAFMWEETPEGFEYWKNIFHKK